MVILLLNLVISNTNFILLAYIIKNSKYDISDSSFYYILIAYNIFCLSIFLIYKLFHIEKNINENCEEIINKNKMEKVKNAIDAREIGKLTITRIDDNPNS